MYDRIKGSTPSVGKFIAVYNQPYYWPDNQSPGNLVFGDIQFTSDIHRDARDRRH